MSSHQFLSRSRTWVRRFRSALTGALRKGGRLAPIAALTDRQGRRRGRGQSEENASTRRPKAPLVGALVAFVLCVGVLFVAVFPTRSYLAQRAAVHKAQHRLGAIDRENRRLAAEARRLSTPTEIERLARAQYGLVRPGEQAYAILPAPKPPIGLPELWPFTGFEHILQTG